MFNKIQKLNFKTKIYNYYRILLWAVSILILYSIIQYNFLDISRDNDSRIWNKEQIKKIIPHRDPFLLIDEIIGGEMGKYVFAANNVD